MSSVDILSALVAPVTSPPAPSADEGDAGAFRQAMDAVANDAETPARADAPAPKKGFLNSAKLAAANAAVTEAAADVEAAPAPPVAAVAPTSNADGVDAGKDEALVASDGTAPAADVAASDTVAVAPVVVPPAPAAQAAAPSESGGAGRAEQEDLSTVGRALGAIDRILNENGVRIDAEASPERLQAVKAAVDQVMAKAPPQVRAKLEALFARILQGGADADASASPATEEAAAPSAQTEAEAVQVQMEAAQAAQTLKAIQAALNAGQTRRPSPASVMRDFAAANAAGAPTLAPRLADPRQETAREAPAAPADAGKPSSGGDASSSANAAASPTPSSSASAKAEPTPEPASVAAAQTDPTVNPAAPADTAAGAPAAHAGSHAVVAEAVRGSPETVAHLSAEILKKLGERSTRFDVELHPADMGRVDVRLTIEADGRLKAQMAFDNPVAAADLRARSDELRRSLEQAGFQVADDSFSFAERGGDGRSFEDARQQFAQDDGRARARAFRAGGQTAELADAPPVARRAVRLGVDVRI